MPRGIYVRTPEYRQKLRDAWYSSDKSRAHIKTLAQKSQTPEKRVNRVFSNQLQRIMRKMKLRKGATAEQILGYTRDQLRRHLEAQFRPGMSWESGGFHVDHIKPVAAFIRDGVTDPAVIHALGNLQILTPHENLTKTDKFPFFQVPA